MKKLIAIMFCILCAGLIFARGSSDSSSSSPAEGGLESSTNPKETASAASSNTGSFLDSYSDAEIERLLSNVSSISFPDGTVFNIVPDNQLITAHEIEHQRQYQNGDSHAIFQQLLLSVFESQYNQANPYEHLGIHEYQAMQAEDRAGKKLNERNKMQ